MKNPFFSVIIPTYNNRDFILEALDSIFKQTMDDYEILVIDDGSTDGTGDALIRLLRDEKISYLHQSNNGPATARNIGIKAAKGQYITFLDADDLLHPDCLREISNYFRIFPELSIIFPNYDIFFKDKILTKSGVDIWKIFRTIPKTSFNDDLNIFDVNIAPYIIKYGSFMHTSGLTVKHSKLNLKDLFKEGYFYGEDDEFWARISNDSTVGYIDKVLSRKRVHQNSLANDHTKLKRNLENQLDLNKLQQVYFRDDKYIQNIINNKYSILSAQYSWHLQATRRYREAKYFLLKSIMRRPLDLRLYKLILKNIICTPIFNNKEVD